MILDYSVQFICDIAGIQLRNKQIKMPHEERNKVTPPQIKHYIKFMCINKTLIF